MIIFMKLLYSFSLRRDPVDGSYLIDRSPTYFEPILNFLRTGSLIINPNINPEGIISTSYSLTKSNIKYIQFLNLKFLLDSRQRFNILRCL